MAMSLVLWGAIIALVGTILAFLLFSAFFHPLTAARRRGATAAKAARPDAAVAVPKPPAAADKAERRDGAAAEPTHP